MKRLLILLLFSGLCFAQTPVNPLGPVGPAGSVQSLSVSPNSIDFNTVQTSTISQSQNITISSQGTIGVTISVSQTGSSDFVFSNLHGCDGLQGSGAVCGLTLTFQPSSAVAKTGSLLIATDIPTNPLITIPLRGTGTAATTFPLTVTALDNGFGTTTSTDGKINCTIAPPSPPSGSCGPINYANGTSVTLTATALAGSTFQSLTGAGCSVSPCTFSMTTPGFTVAADFSANGPAAVASIIVQPTTLLFGQVQNNTPSPAQPVAISNPSPTVPVTVNSVVSSDPHFTAANIHACDGPYNPGGACVLPFVCTPTAGVTYTGTITVNSSAPVNPLIPTTVAVSCSGTATPTFPLTVNGSPTMTGSGTIASNEATPLINCHFSAGSIGTGQCSNNYASGSTPILTATPDSNQTFNAFSGTGCGTTSPSTVTVTAAIVCTASFSAPIPTRTLSISGLNQGGGSITSDVASSTGTLNCISAAGVVSSGGGAGCSGDYPQGTVVTLTAAANGASSFVGWTGVPGCTTATTCQLTVNSTISVAANFASTVPNISLTQSVTNCSVAGATVACNWLSPQIAGDTLMCGVSWPDTTSTISSVADTAGNTYTSALGPTSGTNLRQQIYYAQNIVASSAGANTTTATLSSSLGAISGSTLTNGTSAVAGTGFTTASYTPTANRLVLFSVSSVLASGNGPQPITSITGNSLTYARVAGPICYDSTQGTGRRFCIETWRSLGASPTAGAATITFPSSVTSASWTVSQFSGVDTTGSNGSGAIGNTATAGSTTNPGSPATVTMGTFGSASNATYMTAALNGASCCTAAGSGLAQLGINTSGSPGMADYWAAGNISPATATFSGPGNWGVIGVEIKVPSNRRDMRCAEYSGLLAAGAPVDTSAAAAGTSATAAPGSMTSTVANDLITNFTISNQSVQTPATSFTQRIKDTFGDTLEDIEGTPTGSFNPSDALTTSGNWVSSQLAWKPSNGAVPTTFSLTVRVNGTGAGSITSNLGTPTINCTAGNLGNCSSAVTSSSTVILTAAPQAGTVFGGWTGITGCSASPICTVPSITSNQNISATFTLSGGQAFYVAPFPTGNDSTGNGSQASPWATIDKCSSALTLGASGTTCNVASGTYPKVTTTHSGTATQRIRYVSTVQYGAHIVASGCSVWLNTGNFVDIVGFDMTGNCSNGISLNSSDSIVMGNKVHDLPGTGGFGGIISGGNGSGPFLGNNQIINNIVDNIGPFAGSNLIHGIYIEGPNNIVENNIVSRAAAACITTYHGTTHEVISNNVIMNCGHYGIQISADPAIASNDSTSVMNNIVVNVNGPGIQEFPQTGPNNTYKNNIVYNNSPNFALRTGTQTGTITLTLAQFNALFVNYTGNAQTGNYVLQGGAAGINAGISGFCASGGLTPCEPNFDFNNATRPQGPAPDIGAYEQ